MSENYRKDVDVYSEHCMPEMDGKTKKVYRPNSMRQVSAVKELNRLHAKIVELKALAEQKTVDAQTEEQDEFWSAGVKYATLPILEVIRK